jgi:hypothetical protein
MPGFLQAKLTFLKQKHLAYKILQFLYVAKGSDKNV